MPEFRNKTFALENSSHLHTVQHKMSTAVILCPNMPRHIRLCIQNPYNYLVASLTLCSQGQIPGAKHPTKKDKMLCPMKTFHYGLYIKYSYVYENNELDNIALSKATLYLNLTAFYKLLQEKKTLMHTHTKNMQK